MDNTSLADTDYAHIGPPRRCWRRGCGGAAHLLRHIRSGAEHLACEKCRHTTIIHHAPPMNSGIGNPRGW